MMHPAVKNMLRETKRGDMEAAQALMKYQVLADGKMLDEEVVNGLVDVFGSDQTPQAAKEMFLNLEGNYNQIVGRVWTRVLLPDVLRGDLNSLRALIEFDKSSPNKMDTSLLDKATRSKLRDLYFTKETEPEIAELYLYIFKRTAGIPYRSIAPDTTDFQRKSSKPLFGSNLLKKAYAGNDDAVATLIEYVQRSQIEPNDNGFATIMCKLYFSEKTSPGSKRRIMSQLGNKVILVHETCETVTGRHTVTVGYDDVKEMWATQDEEYEEEIIRTNEYTFKQYIMTYHRLDIERMRRLL